MQRFLQQCKFIGVRMYQLALQVEILGGLLGDPALFRQSIGTIDRQDRKIQEWPVSQASDPARMINFLRASLKRADIQDKKRAERKKKAPVIDVSQGKSSDSGGVAKDPMKNRVREMCQFEAVILLDARREAI